MHLFVFPKFNRREFSYAMQNELLTAAFFATVSDCSLNAISLIAGSEPPKRDLLFFQYLNSLLDC